jgi:hypothetical protein
MAVVSFRTRDTERHRGPFDGGFAHLALPPKFILKASAAQTRFRRCNGMFRADAAGEVHAQRGSSCIQS